jgi:rRNA-processing protein FCF1
VIAPFPGVATGTVVTTLREELSNVINLRATHGTGFDRFLAYLRWSNDAVARFSTVVRPSDVVALVTSARYWILQALDPATRADTLGGFVDLEITDRERTFRTELEELEREVGRWETRKGALVIADTNVFVHQQQEFHIVPWAELVGASQQGAHLIVPLLVIDELDNLKRSGKDTVRTRARVTLRRIDHLLRPRQLVTLNPASATEGPTTAELLLDEPGRKRLERADAELVEVAIAVQQVAGRTVTVVTSDVGMKYRCEAADVAVVQVPT